MRRRLHSELIQTFNEHQQALLGYISKRCNDEHEAEDLLQDLYLKLNALPKDADVRYPKAYLYRIANNLAIDYQRRKARLIDTAESKVYEQEDEASPDTHLEYQQKLDVVINAINELPEKTRLAFKMLRIEQRDKAEVAEIMGVSVNMVEKHLRRAIEYCQVMLKKVEN